MVKRAYPFKLLLILFSCISVLSCVRARSPELPYSNQQKSNLTAGGKEQSRIVEDPARYQYLFQQIQRAVFIRQGLKSYR